MKLLLPILLLSGCAVLTSEHPTDVRVAGLHWYVSAPDFRYQRTEWNVVKDHTMLRAMCGKDWSWRGDACVVRINEGGQCVVFSLLTERQAKDHEVYGGDTVYQHERRHCGLGMPSAAGWSHRE